MTVPTLTAFPPVPAQLPALGHSGKFPGPWWNFSNLKG